jgi:anti-anti-sigma factor
VPLLTIDVLRGSTPVVVCIAGEVDLSTAGLLQALLHTAPDGDLVLDVAGVRFFSAAGLRVLLHERARRGESGAGLVLLDVPFCLRQLLRAAGVELPSAPTLPEAVAVLAQARDRSGEAGQLSGDGAAHRVRRVCGGGQ